jgi:hypothetical protein
MRTSAYKSMRNSFKMTIKEVHEILFECETYRRYIIGNNQEYG